METEIRTLKPQQRASAITFRKPEKSDGSDVWRLIADSGKLDENSMYCNLLQCDHFADTCIIAEMDGEIVGWISGYLQPDDDQAFFVWQVAVSEKARGRGIAKTMLRKLMQRKECARVRRMRTALDDASPLPEPSPLAADSASDSALPCADTLQPNGRAMNANAPAIRQKRVIFRLLG